MKKLTLPGGQVFIFIKKLFLIRCKLLISDRIDLKIKKLRQRYIQPLAQSFQCSDGRAGTPVQDIVQAGIGKLGIFRQPV